MAQWKQIIIFLVITFGIVICIDYESNACNEICQCDEFKNYIRVTCQNQNINTIENLGAPNDVEILDLSKNRLTSLANMVFQSYPSIVNLTLSHNAITSLYLDTFSSLKGLVIVDLSYNMLQEFDNRIFEENTNLVSVDLSSNKFMWWQKDEPILISKSIENLSLKSSQLSYIYPTFLRNLPSLKKLDLSNNLLITLLNRQFSYSTNLHFLNLTGNMWPCDRNFEIVIEYLKGNKVNVENDQCEKELPTVTAPIRFERMQMGPSSSDNYMPNARKKSIIVDFPVEKGFPFFNDLFPSKPKTILKPKYDYENAYEQCTKRIEKLQDQYSEMEISRLSSNDVYFIFFIGVAMGVIGIMMTITCCICVHKMCRKTLRRRQSVQSGEDVRRPNQGPFMSNVLERPRERRRRQHYQRINQVSSNVATISTNAEGVETINGSFIATTAEDNPQNVVIAVRPETPPPSYFDIVTKK